MFLSVLCVLTINKENIMRGKKARFLRKVTGRLSEENSGVKRSLYKQMKTFSKGVPMANLEAIHGK